MTGNSRSNGSVGVRFGNFISVDPAKTSAGFPVGIKSVFQFGMNVSIQIEHLKNLLLNCLWLL